MEQYLDGDEVDVDMILSDGKVTYAKVTDNLPTLEPWFNETGAVTPSPSRRARPDPAVHRSPGWPRLLASRRASRLPS